jgi:hypothetical protein
LQAELRKQSLLNQYRKKALADRIRPYLAGQEFWSLVGELDRQLEQHYQRQPSKKRKVASKDISSPSESEQSIAGALDHRDRLLGAFASVLPSRMECLHHSADAPLFDPQKERLVLDEAEKSGGWMRFAKDK